MMFKVSQLNGKSYRTVAEGKRLESAFDKLMSYARKHTPEGGTLTLRLMKGKDVVRKYRFERSDKGALSFAKV